MRYDDDEDDDDHREQILSNTIKSSRIHCVPVECAPSAPPAIEFGAPTSSSTSISCHLARIVLARMFPLEFQLPSRPPTRYSTRLLLRLNQDAYGGSVCGPQLGELSAAAYFCLPSEDIIYCFRMCGQFMFATSCDQSII